MNKNLLFICHRVPYPPNKGDKIRTFNELKFLSQRYEIDLVSFADNRDELAYEKELTPYCSSVNLYLLPKISRTLRGLKKLLTGGSISQGYFFSHNANTRVAKLIENKIYHGIFCFSSPSAEYVFKNISKIKAKKAPPKLVMDFCDVDSDKWNQYVLKASVPMKWIYQVEAKRLLKYETRISRQFNSSLFVSSEEAGLFKQRVANSTNVFSVSNGVDFDYFSNQPVSPGPKKTLMFAGAMDYYANIEGVTWFCKEVLPLIRQKEPDIRFIIVGSNPTREVKDLESIKGVTVTGFVEDIRPYYNQADVCVIPLRIARGIQNKVLEAMSMNKPVVSTTNAFSGIKGTPGKHLLLADNAPLFVESVLSLLNDPDLARKMGKNARILIEDAYAWNICLKELETVIG